MKRTKTTLLLTGALLLCILAAGSQRPSPEGDDTAPCDTIPLKATATTALRHSGENVIEDTAQVLRPFFLKLTRKQEPVRVVHVGDSHVRGHIFPLVVRHLLEEDFGSEAVEDDKITYQTSGLAT
ncbi:MAG: hypothetical protein LUC33_07180, partial [Prevotellaceae bacterium]|nr:hypothetical protein [Prevotellaceae bacterium]